jgi:hypothetical protein
MPETLTPFLALAGGGLVFAVVAVIFIVMRPDAPGNAVLAGALSAGFAAFTAVTIAAEGVLPLALNHTSNLWGVQVWYDLLFSLSVAVFLILPRARAAGMNIPLWIVLIVATASIGLLAMCARLFWLEQHRETAPVQG